MAQLSWMYASSAFHHGMEWALAEGAAQ